MTTVHQFGHVGNVSLFQGVVAQSGGSLDRLLGITLEIASFETRIRWQVVGVTGDVNPNIRRAGDLGAAIFVGGDLAINGIDVCLLYTSPSPRDRQKSRMPSSA